MEWKKMATQGVFKPRSGHTCNAVGTQLFVFGGKGNDGTYFNDINILDTGKH